MLKKLGFRGRSSPSPSSSSSSSSFSSDADAEDPSPIRAPARSPAPAPGPLGVARPLRLVYCDDKGMFQMDPEAIAALQTVKGPIGVVSVCGRARQGKSFILNQLLGRSSGFQVAATHRPCTKGLWMWSAPLRRTALDGTEYNLVLLDSEGIDAYDQTGTYSTQIFSLAVLLSSMFIYNQMGGIDESALDRLSLVTEMTKHIRVKASGGRPTATELAQFSPVFVWLLRDFYLDLVEDNRRITPRDYLELALRPVQGGDVNVSAKNKIRESIRALFPDRECFTLVRPLNKEADLQRLDQIPIDRLRPEFKSGLDALTQFVFERTRPKQVGATVMTGPILAGVTQSFLDAINKGAVPTISSSWQSVEEAECRRAYDSASEVYTSYFDRTKPAEEALLRDAHEDGVQRAVAAFNSVAVGSGSARLNYEKLLHNFFRKAFEDYKRNAFLEADLRCSNAIQSMETKLRAACHVPGAKFDDVIRVMDNLLAEYESSSHGPAKWKKLSTFIQQCLEGPILDLFTRQLNHIKSERSTLRLKCTSNEDKLEMFRKQLEANEKHQAEYLKRYEEAISDKQKHSEDFTRRLANIQSKCNTLEERCSSLSKALDLAKRESSDWKAKYDKTSSDQKAGEDKFNTQIASMESQLSSNEGRLSAAREQAESAQVEALEWKRKYEVAVGEAKTALSRAALVQERANKKAQEREDNLRAEFSDKLADKEEEIKNLTSMIDHTEKQASSLISQLEVAESKLRRCDLESLALADETGKLVKKLDNLKTEALSLEKEVGKLEQEKNHLGEKYLSECKKFDEAEKRCTDAEREAKRATELTDTARAEAAVARKENTEAQRLAMDRSMQIERNESRVESLERERVELMDEVEKLRLSEMDVRSKVALLEKRVDEREREIEVMMSQNNEQRSNTVQVLESLLATERAAHADATNRAEALSLQLQATQGKLDGLQQELTSVRLNESALEGKLKSANGKRSRMDDLGVESMHDVVDMDVDKEVARGGKRSKNGHSEDGGSIFRGSTQGNEETESIDHTKLTVVKLKQELTKRGFGEQVLHLRNPTKKELVGLYEKHVLGN